jgi:hypothetical protein
MLEHSAVTRRWRPSSGVLGNDSRSLIHGHGIPFGHTTCFSPAAAITMMFLGCSDMECGSAVPRAAAAHDSVGKFLPTDVTLRADDSAAVSIRPPSQLSFSQLAVERSKSDSSPTNRPCYGIPRAVSFRIVRSGGTRVHYFLLLSFRSSKRLYSSKFINSRKWFPIDMTAGAVRWQQPKE